MSKPFTYAKAKAFAKDVRDLQKKYNPYLELSTAYHETNTMTQLVTVTNNLEKNFVRDQLQIKADKLLIELSSSGVIAFMSKTLIPLPSSIDIYEHIKKTKPSAIKLLKEYETLHGRLVFSNWIGVLGNMIFNGVNQKISKA